MPHMVAQPPIVSAARVPIAGVGGEMPAAPGSGTLKIRHCVALVLALGAFVATGSRADEIQRMHADLAGDGKAETITISTTPATKAGRKKIVVRIGASEFSEEFFAADGDVPDARVVAVDRKRSQRQLLVGTPEAGSCIFHLLAYSGKRLIRLLRFDAGPDCRPPELIGNGHLTVAIWQGFWSRNDMYRLKDDGEHLVAEPRETYDVGVYGATGKWLLLQGAECGLRVVGPGTFIRLRLYDATLDRYRIESADGGCGWIPASSVNPLDESIKDLPWAG
jgi:hypothetical protein